MQDIDMLGCEVTDCITQYKGVAVSVSYDVSGCIQVFVRPKMNKDGKLEEGAWFDSKRLKKGVRRMNVPTFVSVAGGEKLTSPERC